MHHLPRAIIQTGVDRDFTHGESRSLFGLPQKVDWSQLLSRADFGRLAETERNQANFDRRRTGFVERRN